MFSLCCPSSSPCLLVTLVSFSLSINFISILIPYIPDTVDLIPGYIGLNNQNTLYVDLIGMGILLTCFFTNKLKEIFTGGSGKKSLTLSSLNATLIEQ